jgi:hypothetical protein
VDRPVLDRLLVVALLIVYVQALTVGVPVKELLISGAGSYCSPAVAIRGSSNMGNERSSFVDLFGSQFIFPSISIRFFPVFGFVSILI